VRSFALRADLLSDIEKPLFYLGRNMLQPLFGALGSALVMPEIGLKISNPLLSSAQLLVLQASFLDCVPFGPFSSSRIV
jgi:hypothetical protein